MCPTITVGSFFRRVWSTFCSFVQHRQISTTSNLNNSNLKSASKLKRKNKTRLEFRYHTKDSPIAPLFSAVCKFFLKLFGWHQRVPLSFVSIFCNTMDVRKSQRVPPLTFFGFLTLFKNLIFHTFSGNYFQSPKGPPYKFFRILQPGGVWPFSACLGIASKVMHVLPAKK